MDGEETRLQRNEVRSGGLWGVFLRHDLLPSAAAAALRRRVEDELVPGCARRRVVDNRNRGKPAGNRHRNHHEGRRRRWDILPTWNQIAQEKLDITACEYRKDLPTALTVCIAYKTDRMMVTNEPINARLEDLLDNEAVLRKLGQTRHVHLACALQASGKVAARAARA